MTPPSRSPWPTTSTTDDQPDRLELSTSGLAAIRAEIELAIRRGLVGLNFAQRCKAAVDAGIASGVVVPPQPLKAAGDASTGQETGNESDGTPGA